ncbi:hypothetical protein E4U39_007906, partial [Claviceps sp. Clav50 group G5]
LPINIAGIAGAFFDKAHSILTAPLLQERVQLVEGGKMCRGRQVTDSNFPKVLVKGGRGVQGHGDDRLGAFEGLNDGVVFLVADGVDVTMINVVDCGRLWLSTFGPPVVVALRKQRGPAGSHALRGAVNGGMAPRRAWLPAGHGSPQGMAPRR